MQLPERGNNLESGTSLEQSAETIATSVSSARRATGPRTEAGKQRSKSNSLKHGIFSSIVVLKDEQRAKFDSLLSGLRDDLKPIGALEEVLVDKLASLVWRHRRVTGVIVKEEPFQNEIGLMTQLCSPPSPDLLLRYEASLERAFDRTLNQLERLQRIRRGLPVPPTLNVNVST